MYALKISILIITSISLIHSGCNKSNENKNITSENPKKDTTHEPTPPDKLIGYEPITIKGFGIILLPPNMEVQEGKYKKLNEKYYEKIGATYPDFVIQQKGLNDFVEEAKNTYARIIIKTILLGPNEKIERIWENFDLSQTDLYEMNRDLKKTASEELRKIGNQLIKWSDLKFVNVNIYLALLSSYIRQLKNNPPVKVNTYIFANYNRMHRIQFSYRIVDEKQWEPVFKNVIDNLKIIDAYKEE